MGIDSDPKESSGRGRGEEGIVPTAPAEEVGKPGTKNRARPQLLGDSHAQRPQKRTLMYG